MFKKRIREAIANNDTSAIVAEFKGVEESISGNIHGNVPRYIVYLGDADIVRYTLEQIAIHECAIGIEDDMAATIIACIAGAVQLPRFANNILAAQTYDIDKFDSTIKSIPSDVKREIQDDEFSEYIWLKIKDFPGDAFTELIAAIAMREIRIKNCQYTARLLFECYKWWSVVPREFFWSMLLFSIDFRNCNAPVKAAYINGCYY